MLSKPLTLQELERALHVAAEAVAVHGEFYLPFFELLEAEYEKRRRHGAAAERALLMAARKMPQIQQHPTP